MYECIIFDVDGTLIDTEKVIIHALQHVLTRRGQRIEDQALRFVFGIPGELSLSRLGIPDRQEALQEWNENIQHLAGNIALFDGVRRVVEALEVQGIKKGIVTSKTRQELRDDFGPFGMMGYFPYSVCADEVTFHKPHPEPLLRCLELASVAPEEALYIGDTIYDAECARDAGVDFALALWGIRHVTPIPAEIELVHPSALLNLVKICQWETPSKDPGIGK